MDERALRLEKRGEHDAAEEIRRQVVEWRKNAQGLEHPDTGRKDNSAGINVRVVPSTTQASASAPDVTPSPASLAKIVEIDKAIGAAVGLASGIDSVIQADFDYVSVSGRWDSEEILVLDQSGKAIIMDDRSLSGQ